MSESDHGARPETETQGPALSATDRGDLEAVAANLQRLENSLAAALAARRQTLISDELMGRIGRLEQQIVALSNPDVRRFDEVGGQPAARGCKDCPGCECTCSDCCCFDIVLESVRIAEAQLEPGDIAEPPAVLIELEIQLFAWLDKQKKIGIVHPPEPGGYMPLRKPLGGIADWSYVGRTINTVCLRKAETRTVEIFFTGLESDHGIERVPHLKDEFGSTSAFITLNCCSQEILARDITLHFTQGGIGGGQRGAIDIRYFARRTC